MCVGAPKLNTTTQPKWTAEPYIALGAIRGCGARAGTRAWESERKNSLPMTPGAPVTKILDAPHRCAIGRRLGVGNWLCHGLLQALNPRQAQVRWWFPS
jgi:hypothetical protein